MFENIAEILRSPSVVGILTFALIGIVFMVKELILHSRNHSILLINPLMQMPSALLPRNIFEQLVFRCRMNQFAERR